MNVSTQLDSVPQSFVQFCSVFFEDLMQLARSHEMTDADIPVFCGVQNVH